MEGKKFQQLADMVFFTRMHEHDHLRLRRKALQGPDCDVQVGDVCTRVIVAPAINEFPDEKIRRLLLQRPVKIAGAVETLSRDAELLIQRAEVGGGRGIRSGNRVSSCCCLASALVDGSADGLNGA